MRIIIATGIYPPDIGGPAQYATQVARALVARGHQVRVVTYGAVDGMRTDEGVPVHIVSRAARSGVRHYRYYRVCRTLAREGVDVAFILDTFSAALPAVMAFPDACRVVRTGGDFVWEQAIEQGLTDLPLSQFYMHALPRGLRLKKWLTQWALGRMQCVIFSTEMQAQLFQRYYGVPTARTRLLMNPVDVDATAAPEDRVPGNEILFAGRLLRLKNIERLIAAFEHIAPEDDTGHLAIVGEGPHREAIVERVSKSPFAARIQVEPALPKSALLSRLAAARMFVLPSLSEVSPNVLLDCVHVGTPFVTTQETGWSDLVCPHALCVNPLSIEALADGMRTLLRDDAWRAARVALCNIEVQQDWEQFTDALEHIFTSLCAS